MPARRRWCFPVFPLNELDRRILALCAPTADVSPALGHPEALVERAAALDVFPLVYCRLRHGSINGRPAPLRPAWEKRFRANAARNLYLHNLQQRLLATLAAAGVLAAPLKGTTLAELAYSDLALRTQVDIDLYVPPQQLPAALEVLAARGYQRVAPLGLRPEQLAATGDEFTSECSLQSTGTGLPVMLELHWRLLPIADEELQAALAPPEEGGAAGHALPPELNFLYLSVRAAAHRWGRLKLLTDLAHWLARQPPAWESLLGIAHRLRLRRLLSITLAALETYFGTPVPEAVRAGLETARPRRLPPAAVANPFAPPPPLSPAAIHRLRLTLREDFRDRLGYLAQRLRPTASDLATVRLPSSLSFVYWGLRWLRLTRLLNRRPSRN